MGKVLFTISSCQNWIQTWRGVHPLENLYVGMRLVRNKFF